MTNQTNNNQERIKKIIVIPNDEIYNLSKKEIRCRTEIGEGHCKTLIRYIFNNEISVTEEEISNVTSQEVVYSLVKQDFCVMLYNSMYEPKTMTIYLPTTLSVKQKEDIKATLANYEDCKLVVLHLNQNAFSYYEEASKSIPYLNGFLKIIPEYKPVANNITEQKKLNHKKNA